jgi:hypothetical protein
VRVLLLLGFGLPLQLGFPSLWLELNPEIGIRKQ